MNKINKHGRLLVLFTVGTLLMFGLIGCGKTVYPIPTFKDGPDVLSLDQLLNDYEHDPAEASAKYEGNIYLFPSVYVEDMVSYSLDVRADPNYYHVANGRVWFKPDYIYDLDKVGIGFVVDILGVVQGWISEKLYIDQCSFNVVEGGELPPPAGY